MRVWWLDCVAGNDWSYRQDPRDSGVLLWVVYRKRRFGRQMAVMPPLTPHLGPVEIIPKPDGEIEVRSSLKLGEDDLRWLQDYAYVSLSTGPGISLAPDEGIACRGKDRMTHLIDTRQGEDSILSSMKKKRRWAVRAGEREFKLKSNGTLDEIWEAVRGTFERKGVDWTFSRAMVDRIHEAAGKRDCVAIHCAYPHDSDDLAAATFFIWDHQDLYYLLGGHTPADNNSKATSALIWSGIKLAREKGVSFDFEGSMDEKIASHFRSYGSRAVNYMNLRYFGSRWIKLYKRIF